MIEVSREDIWESLFLWQISLFNMQKDAPPPPIALIVLHWIHALPLLKIGGYVANLPNDITTKVGTDSLQINIWISTKGIWAPHGMY